MLLNQYACRDLILPIHDSNKMELKDLGNGQSMLNIATRDSISGLSIRGIWSQDPALKQIFNELTKK